MITVDASVTTALSDPHIDFCLLLDLPGPYRITDNVRDITYGGLTYTPDQILMSAGSVNRKRDISADSYEVTLSDVDQTIYQDYIATSYANQEVTVSVAFLDEDGDLIDPASVMPVFKGVLDSWAISESGSTASMKIRLTSHWSQWKLEKGRRTNATSHEEFYPGDTVFEFSHQEELPLRWGL